MTEAELKERGFPEGDAELRKTYERLHGGQPPSFFIRHEDNPEWHRKLVFNAVMEALAIARGDRVVQPLDVPTLGTFAKDDPEWHESQRNKP